MRASTVAYSAPKDGNAEADYEDAWRVLPGIADEIAGDWIGVAVADGATESLLACQWAAMIVDAFAIRSSATRDNASFTETALALAARWPAVVSSYIAERESDGRPLRWYERPGITKGAFATLLALEIATDNSPTTRASANLKCDSPPAIGNWYSAALGDTCLFQVRGEELRVAFPLVASSDFGTNPDLLASCDADGKVITARVRMAMGTVAEGDDFYICTDALAAWFLSRVEAGDRPWETLRDLSDIDFVDWLSRTRQSGELHNDDVTLIHVDIW
jgi:hypothetical protein